MMDEQTLSETMLEQAIDSYPMAELPPNFTYRVMANVQNTPQVIIAQPMFRLNYLDFLIPGFLVLFFFMITAVFAYFVNLDIAISNLGTLFQVSHGRTAVLLAAIFFEVCFGIIAYFYLWSERY